MARATKKRSAGAGKTNKAGRELLKAVREAHHAVTTGDFSGITIRDVEIPDPGEWGPDEVRALRHRLGVSHRVLADLVGVSRALMAHWEYGRRKPARLACRLLDKINEDPEAYMESLIHRKAG
jgi:DNA-binding transcriptional regulator YiaG